MSSVLSLLRRALEHPAVPELSPAPIISSVAPSRVVELLVLFLMLGVHVLSAVVAAETGVPLGFSAVVPGLLRAFHRRAPPRVPLVEHVHREVVGVPGHRVPADRRAR